MGNIFFTIKNKNYQGYIGQSQFLALYHYSVFPLTEVLTPLSLDDYFFTLAYSEYCPPFFSVKANIPSYSLWILLKLPHSFKESF